MPLPTTFAGASARSEGEFKGSYGTAPIGGPYFIRTWQDSAFTKQPIDNVTSIYVDTSGNIYSAGTFLDSTAVGGTTTGGNNYQGQLNAFSYNTSINGVRSFVFKHDSSGNQTWAYKLSTTYTSTGLPQNWQISKVIADTSGNAYICAFSPPNDSSSPSWGLVACISSTGSIVWQKIQNMGIAFSFQSYASQVQPEAPGIDIALDSSNRLHIVYNTNALSTTYAYYSCLNAYAGTAIGSRGINLDGPYGSLYPSKIKVDASGNVYFLGQQNNIASGGSGYNGIVIMKYPSTIYSSWAYSISPSWWIGSSTNAGTLYPFLSMDIDSSGNVYTASFVDYSYISIQKITSSGGVAWTKYITSGTATGGYPFLYSFNYGLAIDPTTQNITLVGNVGNPNTTSGSINGDQVGVIITLNSSGSLVRYGGMDQNPQIQVTASANSTNSQYYSYGSMLSSVFYDVSGNAYFGGSVATTQNGVTGSKNSSTYYYKNGIIVKDTNAYQTTHANTSVSMNSNSTIKWSSSIFNSSPILNNHTGYTGPSGGTTSNNYVNSTAGGMNSPTMAAGTSGSLYGLNSSSEVFTSVSSGSGFTSWYTTI